MTRKVSVFVSREGKESEGFECGKRSRSRRFDMWVSFDGRLTSLVLLICRQKNRTLVEDKSQLYWDWSRTPRKKIALDSLAMQVPSRRRMSRDRRDDRPGSNRLHPRFAGHTRGSNLETSLNPWSLLERGLGKKKGR